MARNSETRQNQIIAILLDPLAYELESYFFPSDSNNIIHYIFSLAFILILFLYGTYYFEVISELLGFKEACQSVN